MSMVLADILKSTMYYRVHLLGTAPDTTVECVSLLSCASQDMMDTHGWLVYRRTSTSERVSC